MKPSRKYPNLTFGAPAAERDILQGLNKYFVESDAFRRVASGEKTIILGNRGTGKSAIFKVLARRQRDSGSIVIELNPDNYAYDMLKNSLRSEDQGAWAKQGAYAASWKYLIYVLIMKALNDDGPTLRTGSGAKLYNYLRDNHPHGSESAIALLISYLKRIEGFKVGFWETGIKAHELTRLYKLDEITPLKQAIREVSSKRKVLIFVDELDRGWDASEDAQAFVTGLFQACTTINAEFENIRLYVSLRRELYNNIPALYDDAQKFRDMIETIYWNEESLMELVTKRIKYKVPELEKHSDVDCWNRIFLSHMGSRREKSFRYLLDRTLYRPREVLSFCIDALEANARTPTWPINHRCIATAEYKYSSDRIRDIDAEYRFQYPGLMSIFEAFRESSPLFTRDELESLCLCICAGEFHIQSEAQWVIDQDPEYLIDVLWRVGFLRAQSPLHRNKLNSNVNSYIGSYEIEHLSLRNVKRFEVHCMFRSYLGIADHYVEA